MSADTGAGTPPEWIDLAADIRAVDGNHDLGAGSLAVALMARGWTRRPATDPATDHPHDGYAYDGCTCACCTNVRIIGSWRNG